MLHICMGEGEGEGDRERSLYYSHDVCINLTEFTFKCLNLLIIMHMQANVKEVIVYSHLQAP